MLTAFLYSLLDIIEIFGFFAFVKINKPRYKYFNLIIILIIGILNFVVANLLPINGLWIELLLFSLQIITIYACFKKFNTVNFVFIVLLYFISYVEVMLTMTIDSVLQTGLMASAMFPLVIHVFRIITYYLIGKLVIKFNIKNHFEELSKLLYTMIPFVFLILLIFEGYFIFGESKFYSIIIISTVFIGFGIFGLIANIYYKQSENNRLLIQNKMLDYAEYNHLILEEKSSEIYKIKHDILNELSVVKTLIDGSKIDEAKEYLDNTIGKVKSVKSFNYSGYKYLDALLNFKQHQNDDVELIFNIAEINISKQLEFDCCTIISNILDNAISEISKHHIKTPITLIIEQKHGHLVIRSNNNINNEKTLLTEKDNKVAHGHGLGIIQSIVNKYNGELIIEQDQQFKLALFLQNE